MQPNYEWMISCCTALRSSIGKEELEHHLVSFLQPAGFSGFTFLETDEAGIDFVLHNCTYSSNWPQRYFDQDYGAIDPVIHRMFTETQPYRWSAAEYKKSKDKRVVAFFRDAENHEISQGISVPIKRGGKIRLFTAITGSRKKIMGQDLITMIKLIAENYNMMFLGIEERAINSLTPAYTPREKQALTLTALGATSGEAARILGISPKTLEKQLQLARDKMWARSQVAATAFALDGGIIHLKVNTISEFNRPRKYPIRRLPR
ncbi:MAG: autoinducer binding domain-containing protein [Pseudomonadota bacterium]